MKSTMLCLHLDKTHMTLNLNFNFLQAFVCSIGQMSYSYFGSNFSKSNIFVNMKTAYKLMKLFLIQMCNFINIKPHQCR